MNNLKFIKNGKECYLCLVRKKLIQITPEEKVRQNFIKLLIEEYEVPAELIDVEVPLSHYEKNLRGRVDIIVSGRNKKDNIKYPLLIVECKESNIPLIDKVIQQAKNYDNILYAKVVVITNGLETLIMAYDDKKNDYIEIDKIPNYYELISANYFNPKIEKLIPWKRPNHLKLGKNVILGLIDDGIIGEESNSEFYSFFSNIHGLLLNEKDKIENLNFKTNKFIQDGGVRFTSFGNASGGTFVGDYRYIILEDEKGDTQIVSFTLMGKLSSKNHPKYGNSTGYTLMLVAIDDYERSHLSIELALDRFITKDKDKYSVWHDGTLTVGKKGRVKNQEVIDFVKIKNPKLVSNNKIIIGTLDNSSAFNWGRKDVNNFFTNIIEYSLLRDQFRKTK